MAKPNFLTRPKIEATIDKIVDRTMRMDMTWDWPCGDGLLRHLRGI